MFCNSSTLDLVITAF